MKIFSFLFIFLLCTLLAACSKYKIAYDYSPPTTKSGIVCISNCQKQLTQCNRQCGIQYQHCSVNAAKQAKKALPVLLEAYPLKLEIWLNAKARYEYELDWYEFQHFRAISRRDHYVDHCMKNGKKRKPCHRIYRHDHHDPYLSLHRPYFDVPRPLKPTLASETQRIKKASCSSNCACDKNYRLCYTSCGGVVKSKKVCVTNCN